MSRNSAAFPILLALLILPFSACGDDDNSGSNGEEFDPDIPTSWANQVTNTFFPLAPGTILEYNGDGETGRVEVLATTRVIQGVTATVVRDQVFVSGELTEDTDDWYAQDTAGNVWYL